MKKQRSVILDFNRAFSHYLSRQSCEADCDCRSFYPNTPVLPYSSTPFLFILDPGLDFLDEVFYFFGERPVEDVFQFASHSHGQVDAGGVAVAGNPDRLTLD